jgi:signal transduction histidine kinase
MSMFTFYSSKRLSEGKLTERELKDLNKDIFSQGNIVNEGMLVVMFLFGIFISFFYDTWLIAVGIGSLCMIAFYTTKKMLPDSDLYQYVLSAVSAIFSAMFIYQMHGMAEMHFWVFISSTILIIYQNWKLQIPLIVIVIIHHATFGYLQYAGYKEVYFTQLDYMDLTTFIFHGVLATCVCFISALWSYTIHERTKQDALNLKAQIILQTELQNKNEELMTSEEELRASQEELTQINENLNGIVLERTRTIINQNDKFVRHAFINGHKVRGPLARILGLVNLLGYENNLEESTKELQDLLKVSASELNEILREVRVNLDEAEYKELPSSPDSNNPKAEG